MAPARLRSAATRRALARLALGALILTAAADADADGEQSPVLGGALIGGRGPDPDAELAGLQLEVAWWRGRLGLAVEGAAHWTLGGGETPATVLGASARIRLFEQLLPALLEPRDVELGVELHGIVQRTWTSDADPERDPVGYGLGLAVRLRGDSDDFPKLFTESRLFLRVISTQRTQPGLPMQPMQPSDPGPIFLTMSPSEPTTSRELTILIGIGAAFGVGEPRYLDRFRTAPVKVELPDRPLGRSDSR
jgi:hypothetical protein